MAYWFVASRVEGTERRVFGSTASKKAWGEEAAVEGRAMNSNRMRHLTGLRFEAVQKARAMVEAGRYDNDAFLDACLDELLADLA